VTNAAQTRAAVERVESLDVLINNASVALHDHLSGRAALEQHLAVNLFGPHAVTQACLSLLTRSRGAVVNVLSVAAFAALPIIPAYSISKAAFNLTQWESVARANFDGVEKGRRRRRTSSPIPCPRPWRRAGAAARLRRSSASMRRS
jgi:NAD(P)-dependent dehydrogenase (short-subunit alcohol dehydrogenase family)